MRELLPHFVNGAFWDGDSGDAGDVYNPALGKAIRKLKYANAGDVNVAVTAAASAVADWSAQTPLRRARVLFRFKEQLESRIDELAECITEEHGKTLSDAKAEIRRGIDVVEYACGIPTLLQGSYSEDAGTDVDCYSVRQPLGVVAGITPFNFPAMVPLWMVPLAIACGNTFVLKTSEKVPSAATVLAHAGHDAGIPAGVFNVIHGDSEAASALIQHEAIKAVSFVGSTRVARRIQRLATDNGKRVQALGGAKNHMVILPDADMEHVTRSLIGAAFGSAGERCMAISVAVPVGTGTADRLVENLRKHISTLKVGPGTSAESDLGPLITAEHLDCVAGFVARGVEEGAELVVDGRGVRIGKDNFANGYFLGPCLFDRVTPAMDIYREEIFGPVLAIVRTNSLADALSLINENRYGNGVAVFTKNGGSARRFVMDVDAGMVGVNVPIPVPVASHGFGGWNDSMFGDHGIYGREGVRFFTRRKTVTQTWHDVPNNAGSLDMPSTE